ncbi:hypothetical protein TA3x_001788 [Tundrisphaera sp. TA3]|uniref:hypothetical protein n=1 Tax=Tundrisphaera sp. TA3 TaxID=3435775 RepID=UPI003EBF7321
MRRLPSAGLGVAFLLATAPAAWAQIPGVPTGAGGVPGIPAAAGIPAAGTPVAVPMMAPPKSIWSCLGLSKGGLAACRAKLCQSPLGGLLNGGLTPLSALSGGIVPQVCPPNPLGNNPAGGPESATSVANKIAADEAGAKARVAAVEYLGTVDCHYWPDAEKALIDSLRADRNECVRYAAARVLGSGCCCTKKTIAALTLTASASKEDGNPSENSPRVRAAAMAALNRCSCRPIEIDAPAPIRPESPPPAPAPIRPEAPTGPGLGEPPTLLEPLEAAAARERYHAYYEVRIGAMTPLQVMAGAKHALAIIEKRGVVDNELMLTGRRSIAGALAVAANPRPAPAPTPDAEPAPATAPAPALAEPARLVPQPRVAARVDPEVSSSSLRPRPTVAAEPAPAPAPKSGRSMLQIIRQSRSPDTR